MIDMKRKFAVTFIYLFLDALKKHHGTIRI
jgi:hypothetical protein